MAAQPTQQTFLLDDKKLGKILHIESYQTTASENKGKKITKRHFQITAYTRLPVPEGGKASEEKLIKWGEFGYNETMHPIDKIKAMLSHVEIPYVYLSDGELVKELTKRELMPFQTMSDQDIADELKRREILEFETVFKIPPNLTLLQKLKLKLKRKKIPVNITYADAVSEFKNRNIIPAKEYFKDEELIKELADRDIIPFQSLEVQDTIDELKRRSLIEFETVFKISPNAGIFKRIKAWWKKEKLPIKTTYADAISEFKKRNIILTKDYFTDEEILKDATERGLLPKPVDPPIKLDETIHWDSDGDSSVYNPPIPEFESLFEDAPVEEPPEKPEDVSQKSIEELFKKIKQDTHYQEPHHGRDNL